MTVNEQTVRGKVLREDIKDGGFLLKTGQTDAISRAGDEEFDQMSRGGGFSQLT